jgi:S1-C subfamily serine protease
VVNVYAARVVENRNPFMEDPFFRRFFGGGGGGMPREQVQRSLGSGVIVDASGLVMTNNHVIEGATEVKIALADKREFEAEILLKDARTDLAVLRVRDGREKFTRSTSAIRTSCRSATWCWRSAIRSASDRP